MARTQSPEEPHGAHRVTRSVTRSAARSHTESHVTAGKRALTGQDAQSHTCAL